MNKSEDTSLLKVPVQFQNIPFTHSLLRIILLPIILGFSVILTSCHGTKKIMRAPIKEEGAEYLFNKLKEYELKYDWFTAKFSAEYQNENQRNSFNGQIRIRRDSLIWISFSPLLGIEVFRMMITQDSIKFINRINDTYFKGDYNFVNNFLHANIDYDILQSFLIGNDLSFYENGSFRASIDNNQYKLSTAERRKLRKFVRSSHEKLRILIQNIWIDPSTFKITRANVKEIQKPNMQLEASYSEFENTGTQSFPSKMSYKISADNDIRVLVNFSKINVGIPQSFPFRIPSGYRQIK
ncbi:MAG: DUF4292 domain-containing protein [Bacteroidetes bacterium]|nr:DUF4292 domain-containing protein [Bacteroidota bacterium]